MHYIYWWRSIYDCHLFLPINISSLCKNWIVFQVVFHLFVWKSNFHHLSVLYSALIKFLLTEVSGYIMWGHPLFLTKRLTSSQPDPANCMNHGTGNSDYTEKISKISCVRCNFVILDISFLGLPWEIFFGVTTDDLLHL